MTRPRPGIGSELLPVGLILLCLVGTWTLVVAMHRRGAAPRDASASAAPATPPTAVSAAPAAPPPEEPAPEPPPASPPPPPPVAVEDPTEKALGQLSAAEAEQVRAAQEADQKAAALETARQKVVAEAERYHRRNSLVLKQLENLHDQAQKLETELTEVALERDVLASERDAMKAALAKARTRSSYAVLPHKAQNGTWRRPIIIECKNGQATLQPGGPSFSLLELSMILGPNGSPIVGAVAREAVKAQGLTSPDGAPVVPYIFFVVRPDGIKPYYNARAQLEPLGISFGYELVDQNMEIEFPDLDNIDEWDGSGMPRPSQPAATQPLARAEGNRPWPAPPTGGSGHGSDDPSNTFVWPARPPLAAGGPGGGGSGSGGTGEPGAENRGGPGGAGGIGRGSGSGGGGVLDFPRGGRPGLGTRDAATARGPYGARDGLGQGGSGVDLVPQGTPGLDPSNPYDASGPVGSLPPRTRSGGPPPMGGYGTGAGRGAAAGTGTETGPRLIPVSPEGMPGLEAPNASQVRGTGNTAGADPTRRGGWIVSSRDLGPTPDPAGAPSGAGGNTPSTDTDPSVTPFPVPSAGPSVASSGGGTPPSIVPAPPAGSTGAASTTSSASSSSSTTTATTTPAPAPAASNLGNLAAGRPYSPTAAAGGRFAPDQGTQPATATSESVQGGTPPQQQGAPGTANPNLGAPPPLSQLARLAGTASPDGAPGQPSKLASASPFGIPLPMPPAGSDGDDDSDPSQQKAEKGATSRAPRSRLDRRKPMSIDVPFEMVVACAPDGVVIHPGGYRLSAKALKSQDGLLLQNLKTIVQARRQVDPMIHPKPSIRFLVEPGGSETYRDARKQTFLSGFDWPVSLQVSDSDILDNVAPRESF